MFNNKIINVDKGNFGRNLGTKGCLGGELSISCNKRPKDFNKTVRNASTASIRALKTLF